MYEMRAHGWLASVIMFIRRMGGGFRLGEIGGLVLGETESVGGKEEVKHGGSRHEARHLSALTLDDVVPDEDVILAGQRRDVLDRVLLQGHELLPQPLG
jgi:hypothetical protein